MKKRLLSILLCLTMVTGLLPTAFAAEKDTETEFPYTYNTKKRSDRREGFPSAGSPQLQG